MHVPVTRCWRSYSLKIFSVSLLHWCRAYDVLWASCSFISRARCIFSPATFPVPSTSFHFLQCRISTAYGTQLRAAILNPLRKDLIWSSNNNKKWLSFWYSSNIEEYEEVLVLMYAYSQTGKNFNMGRLAFWWLEGIFLTYSDTFCNASKRQIFSKVAAR